MKNINYLEKCFSKTVEAENLVYKINGLLNYTEIDDEAYNKIDELLKIIWDYAEKVGNEIENAPF